jgi:hypothetical protein
MRGTGLIRVDSANFIQYLAHKGVLVEISRNITAVEKRLNRRCNIKPPNSISKAEKNFVMFKLFKLN